MSNAVAGAATERKETEVNSSFIRLEQEITRLENKLNELEGRIDPGLCAPMPQEEPPKGLIETTCDIGRCIEQATGRLANQNDKVQQFIDRCQL